MSSEKIQYAACWYKLARAMAIADTKSIEIEEQAALRYLLGFLDVHEQYLYQAKQQAEELELEEVIEMIAARSIAEREQILTGMLLVARADGEIHERERDFISDVVEKWEITPETLQTLSLRAKGIDEAIKDIQS